MSYLDLKSSDALNSVGMYRFIQVLFNIAQLATHDHGRFAHMILELNRRLRPNHNHGRFEPT